MKPSNSKRGERGGGRRRRNLEEKPAGHKKERGHRPDMALKRTDFLSSLRKKGGIIIIVKNGKMSEGDRE